MAAFSGIDLKNRRELLKMSAADLADKTNCDTSTIYKIESGKTKVNPDLMYQIAVELHEPSIWGDWMRTEYPTSYGRMHPETPVLPLTGALMMLGIEMSDVTSLMHDAQRDVADGRFDDRVLAGRMRKELEELVGAGQRMLCEMAKQGV